MQAAKGGTPAIHLPPQHFAEVLSALRAEAASGAHERRQVTRIEVQAPVKVARYDAGVISDERTVLTRDLSIGGLGMLFDVQLPVGQELIVRLARVARKPPLVILCRVTHCRQLADSMFGVGILFHHLLDEDAENNSPLIEALRRTILS